MNQPLDYATPTHPKRRPWMLLAGASLIVMTLVLMLILLLVGVQHTAVPAPARVTAPIGMAPPAPPAPMNGGN
jgi:hypothetical protein